jgi:hypothetical protein
MHVCTTVVIGETLEKAWKAPVSGRIDGVTAFGFDRTQLDRHLVANFDKWEIMRIQYLT